MEKAKRHAIAPTREENYAEWYQQVIQAGDLAENSVVRGCMVIKPWGYAIWENIQRVLDGMIKATGHKNAYFPLFIPLSFLEKEATHVEGFAKECAIVTHSRLQLNAEGKLVPTSPLEEPLIVRPTSETIIGESFSKWVQSYRDLPLLINQWANVVRWEMRTRMFLRTSEFLWQEGHTAHATEREAVDETYTMLRVYEQFARETLAMPVIVGEKTAGERFPGAVNTYCIEAMMQDRKALQAGTSHFLGQNFARSSNIQFADEKGETQHAWTTSWGVSTRLIGGVIMSHADDDGLILPPQIAPLHVVILPVLHKDQDHSTVLQYANTLKSEIEALTYGGQKIRVEIDARDKRGGDKVWEWIKKGVPVRVEVGPRECMNQALAWARRDTGEKTTDAREQFIHNLPELLVEIQQNIYRRAEHNRVQNTVQIDSKEAFYAFFTPKNASKPEIHGGFASCHWCGDETVTEQIKNDLKVTIRCIPIDEKAEPGTCIFTGQPSPRRVLFAKSY